MSKIQIFPVKIIENLITFASYVINNALYIGNIAVYSSPSNHSGFRLVYPAKILPNGKEIHCVHPINKMAGELISKAIVGKFKEIILKEKR